MYVVVQHPFADLRAFLGKGAGRLARPLWPLAQPDIDFVRGSGHVMVRTRGGIDGWPGQEVFGSARNALKFPNRLGIARLGSDGVQATVHRSFRRFYSDGTVARLEVGIAATTRSTLSSRESWIRLLGDLADLPVKICDADGQRRTCNLLSAGPHLATHYLRATTSKENKSSTMQWWLSAGTPALIVESDELFESGLPPTARRILDVRYDYELADDLLAHAWLQYGKQRCSTWFINGSGRGRDFTRRLRLHIAGFHAAREALRMILALASDGDKLGLADNKERANAVQSYLNEAIRILHKHKRFGFEQSAMFEATREAFDKGLEGQASSLGLMRRQLTAKVESYLRASRSAANVTYNVQGDVMNTSVQLGSVSVSGDFNLVTAANIQNSYNKASNAPSAELREALKTLTDEVAKMSKELPEEKAEQLSKDLDVIASEAASQQPRKEWYELAAKGIEDAAKIVGVLGGPVIAALQLVAKALGWA
jgi:hypothetical protein